MRPLALPALIAILGAAAGCGPNPPGYTPFYHVYEDETPGRTHPDSIQVWFSPLASVDPYVHRTTTGLAIEAPELDPREFCSPDSIVKRYIASRGLDLGPSALLGLPKTNFSVLGEITVPLYVVGLEMAPDQFTNTKETGPHRKPFREPSNVDWGLAFRELRWRASRAGADAVVEVVAGKLPVTVWYPPRPYGPLPQSSGVGVLAVRGEGITEWALMGMAISWREYREPERGD